MANIPRVLVVDDEEDVILLCSVNLEAEGYEVLEARNGKEAVEVARAEQPDVIFLDIMMPVMDGWQALGELKGGSDTKHIPVVLLTAKVNAEDQLRGLSAGADDYVTKPFHPTALTQAVPTLLQASPEDRDKRRKEMIRRLQLIDKI